MDELHGSREVSVVELVDRLLDKGVVLAGDITISVADVPLVYLGLRVLLSSVETAERFGAPVPGGRSLERDALGSDALGSSIRGDAFDADASHADALKGVDATRSKPRPSPRDGR